MISAEVAHRLAELVQGVTLEAVPSAAINAARRSLIDVTGVSVAAVGAPFARSILDVGRAMGEGQSCSIFGSNARLSPPAAALVNGTLAHGLDFDDTHLPSLAHLTATVLPAAAAACELRGASVADLLSAQIAGVEIGGRLGDAVRSASWGGSSLRKQGFFSTSAIGTVAAAAGAAHALGLSVDSIAGSLTAAANLACGTVEVARGDGWSKRSQVGWAAHAGLCAAFLARAGFGGPRRGFESDVGYFTAFAGGRFMEDVLSGTAADEWACERVSFKVYPVEHYIQPLLELAERCRVETGWQPSDILELRATIPSQIQQAIAEPVAVKSQPEDGYAAQMSARYCLARAFTKLEVAPLGLSDFTDQFVLDDETRRLGELALFDQEPTYDASFPERAPARLSVRSTAGSTWTSELMDAMGTPSRPMSDADLLSKFHRNCRCIAAGQRSRFLDSLVTPECVSVADLLAGIG